MRKKVGIITLWGTPVNYGQILQAYALSQYIRSVGFDTFIIRYKDKDSKSYDSWYKKIKRVLTGQKSISTIIKRYTCKHEQTANRGFKEFGERYLNFTDRLYTSFDDLKENFPPAEFYITGSDQVWGAYGSINCKKVYLLDFLPEDVKRISYAASFGRNKLNQDEIETFKSALNKFTYISVREESGCKICASLGIDKCKWVSDPTLLLPKETWFSLLRINYKEVKDKIVLFYILTNDENNRKIYKIANYLKRKGYIIKYVTSSYYLDKKANFNPTIEEWLSTLDMASLVVTNSYHGTIFSLIFNTPFFFLSKTPVKEGQNSRLQSILNKTKLLDRIVNAYSVDYIKNKLYQDINWEYVNSCLDEQRQNSIDFIKNALNL